MPMRSAVIAGLSDDEPRRRQLKHFGEGIVEAILDAVYCDFLDNLESIGNVQRALILVGSSRCPFGQIT